MYSTLFCGETHHKTSKNQFKILDFYYKNKVFMFILILGTETSMLTAYLNKFSVLPHIVRPLMIVCFPLMITKHIINVF